MNMKKILALLLGLNILLLSSVSYIQAALDRPSRPTLEQRLDNTSGLTLPKLPHQPTSCDRERGFNNVTVKEYTGIIKKANVVPGSVKVGKDGVEADIEIRNGTDVWLHLQHAGEGGGAEIGPKFDEDPFWKYELLPPSTTSIFVHVKFVQKDQMILLQFDQGERAIPIGVLSPILKAIPGGSGITDAEILLAINDFSNQLILTMENYNIFGDFAELAQAKGFIAKNRARLSLISDLFNMLLSSEFQDILLQAARRLGLDMTIGKLAEWVGFSGLGVLKHTANQWALVLGTITSGGRSYVEIKPSVGTTTRNLTPCPPYPYRPNNQILLNNPPTFSWRDSLGADKYLISISKYKDFSEILYEKVVFSTSHTPEILLPISMVLFWRVKAGNDTGYSNWSPTSVFAVCKATGCEKKAPGETPSPSPLPQTVIYLVPSDGSPKIPFGSITEAMGYAKAHTWSQADIEVGEGLHNETIYTYAEGPEISIVGKGQDETKIVGDLYTGAESSIFIKDLSWEGNVGTGTDSEFVLKNVEVKFQSLEVGAGSIVAISKSTLDVAEGFLGVDSEFVLIEIEAKFQSLFTSSGSAVAISKSTLDVAEDLNIGFGPPSSLNDSLLLVKSEIKVGGNFAAMDRSKTALGKSKLLVEGDVFFGDETHLILHKSMLTGKGFFSSGKDSRLDLFNSTIYYGDELDIDETTEINLDNDSSIVKQ